MKCACVTICLLITLQAVWSHSAPKGFIECAEELNVHPGDIEDYVEGKDSPNNVKCFMKCVMMRMGALDEDGTILISKLAEEHKDVTEVAEECAKLVKNDDLCELAYQHAVCMRDKSTDDKWKAELLENAHELH